MFEQQFYRKMERTRAAYTRVQIHSFPGPYRQFLVGCVRRNADRDVLSYAHPEQTGTTPAEYPSTCSFNLTVTYKQDALYVLDTAILCLLPLLSPNVSPTLIPIHTNY